MGGSMLMTVLILMVSGSPSNELLDYVDTDVYWKTKDVVVSVETMTNELGLKEKTDDVDELIRQLGAEEYRTRESAHRKLLAAGASALPELRKAVESPDPEVATRARRILSQLTGGGGEVPVRRLMAIRTLGELNDAAAVPTLKRLLKSERPFEADYAARALAAIRQQPIRKVGPSPEKLRDDIWLLPKGCRLVAHMRGTRGKPVLMKEVLKGLPPEMGEIDRDLMAKKVTGMVVGFAELVGNLRLDAVTLGLSENLGKNSGFVVVIGRGRYDRDAVLSAMKKEAGADPDDFAITKVDGMEVVTLEHGEFNLILHRGERFVIVGGPVRRDEAAFEKLPVKQMVKALKTGHGGLKDEPEMVKLIASTGPACETMVVMKVCPSYREAPFVAAFDTLVLTTRGVTEGTEWKLVARGTDVEAVTKAAADFNKAREEALNEMKNAPEQLTKTIEPLTKMMETLKIEQDEETVAVTTTSPKGTFSSLLSFVARFLGLRF